MLDEITEAVLSREEIARVPRGQPRATSGRRRARADRGLPRRAADHAALLDLPRAEASALSDPSQDRAHRRARRRARGRGHARGRVVYASNHRSHTDYLVEPLVLDDNGVRPPIIAAGINLFGGPLGLLHRHVTGAIPIRRNTKDPAYLITLKAYVAELLRKHDLFFYPGRRPQLQRRDQDPEDGADPRGAAGRASAPGGRADRDRLRPGARGSRPGAAAREAPQRPFSRELAEMVRYAVGYRSRAFVTFGKPIPSAHRRRLAPRRARSDARGDGARSAGSTRCCRRRSSPPRCGRRSRGASWSSAPTRSSTRCAPRGANLGVHERRRKRSTPPLEPLEARGIMVVERGRVPRARAQRAALLRALARSPARLAVRAARTEGHDASARQGVLPLLSRSALLKRLASRYGMATPTSFARRFIAGETVDEADRRRAQALQAQGLLITLDYLGESVTTTEEADAATARIPSG